MVNNMSNDTGVYIGTLTLPEDLEFQDSSNGKYYTIPRTLNHPIYRTVGDDYVMIGRLNENDEVPVRFNNTAYFDLINHYGAVFNKMEIISEKFGVAIDLNKLRGE